MKQFGKAALLASLAFAGSTTVWSMASPPKASADESPAGKCNVPSIQAMVDEDTTIESAEPTALPAPHCRIDGYVTTTNPGPNKVRFRLQLPDQGFNGRFLFAGLGGAAGYVPTDLQLPRGNPVSRGYAMAGTDTGHTGEPLDWSFMSTNAGAAKDYVDRGGHVATVATQAITRAYYGIDKLWRYHTGCSGGGRMGVAAIERYPDDYDGVLVGAPGRSSATMMMFMWATQQQAREPGGWLSPAKLAFAESRVTAQCDALDGAVDGIVSKPSSCGFRPQELLCKAGQTEGCLTVPEVRTMTAILDGPRGPDGKRITGGMPMSNMAEGWSAFLGRTPPPWSDEITTKAMMAGRTVPAAVMSNVMARNYFGPDFDYMRDFDFNDQKSIDGWWEGVRKLGWGEPASADLRPAEKRGMKIIWWHGISDAGPTLDTSFSYRRDALALLGGDEDRLGKTYQFYTVPGMLHCGAGTGPGDVPDRLLLELMDWAEKGIAPGPVVAGRGPGKARPLFQAPGEGVAGVAIPGTKGGDREFLLCPYPQEAKFDGTPGGENEAAHYSCTDPN